MKSLTVGIDFGNILLQHFHFCGLVVFTPSLSPRHIIKRRVSVDCKNWSYRFTKDWAVRTEQKLNPTGMNCVIQDENVVIYIPKGLEFAKVSASKTHITFTYPQPDALSMLRTLEKFIFSTKKICLDDIEMNVIHAITIGTMTVSKGLSDGIEGARIIYDMVQDGELGQIYEAY